MFHRLGLFSDLYKIKYAQYQCSRVFHAPRKSNTLDMSHLQLYLLFCMGVKSGLPH
jgi:hypothetical protein